MARLVQFPGHPQQLAAQIDRLARQPHALLRQQHGGEGAQHLHPHAALGVARLPRRLVGQRLGAPQANGALPLEFHHLRHPDLGVVGEFQSGTRRLAVAAKGRGEFKLRVMRVELRLGYLAAGDVHAVPLDRQGRVVSQCQMDRLGQRQ